MTGYKAYMQKTFSLNQHFRLEIGKVDVRETQLRFL